MKNENPIEEVWRIRDELSAEYGYDVHRIFGALREEEKQYGDRVVRSVPRRVPAESADALREVSSPYGTPGSEEATQAQNPIEEVRRIREQIWDECGHDVHRLFERLKVLEAKHKDRLVSFAPRTPTKPAKKKRAAKPK